MKCTNCGKEVPESANVCGYCGHRLKSTPSPVATAPTRQVAQTKSVTRSSPGTAAPLPEAGRRNISQVSNVWSEEKWAADWGYKNWIKGALLWSVAYLLISLLWAGTFYIGNFYNQQSIHGGFWEYYAYSYGGFSWIVALLVWGVPGALSGGTYESGKRMLWGVISIPLGLLFGGISIAVGSQFSNFIAQIRTSLDMIAALGALIVVWIGPQIIIPNGLPSILRWIFLIWCGIIIGVYSMGLLGLSGLYAPIVFSLAGIILSVYVGLRERKRNRMS